MKIYLAVSLLLILFFVLPKVDYVLITSLLVCKKFEEVWMAQVYSGGSFYKKLEVIVCNGTVWQQMVLFCFES